MITALTKLYFGNFKRADDITGLLSDTTLLVHFFGKKGKAELNFEDFYRWNLTLYLFLQMLLYVVLEIMPAYAFIVWMCILFSNH